MQIISSILTITALTFALWQSVAADLAQIASVDKVLVVKSERKMQLLADDNEVLREYSIALGDNPLGHKQQEGDERTPEGFYQIDYRNPNSRYHLSLHINYPNAEKVNNV